MKNAIRYYYQLEIEDINYKESRYFFDEYTLVEHRKDIDLSLYQYLNQNKVPNYEIIWNKDNNYITSIEGKNYILLKKNRETPISFEMLEKFYMPINKKETIAWHELWINKIDYYEKHILTLSSKKLKESFSYYSGLTENAISFYQLIKKDSDLFISHSKLSATDDFLNPLNFTIDYKARDVAEYTKYLFINDELNINDLFLYFQSNNFNEQDLLLFYARLLYPSYYFDCYDVIGRGGSDDCLDNIINKVDSYEILLRDIYFYIKQYINIPKIDWIVNKNSL